MRKSKNSSIIILACVICFTGLIAFADNKISKKQTGLPVGPDPVKEWKFSKQLQCKENKNTYKYFSLDADVYRYAADDLSDLRIINALGDNFPYFIEHGSIEYNSREILYASKNISREIDQEKKTATFDFQLIPQKKNISGYKLILTVPYTDYSKQIIIYGRNADTDWEQIKKESIYQFETYKKNEIQFDTDIKYSFYRIVVINAAFDITITKLFLAGKTGIASQKLYQKKNIAYSIKQEESSTLIELKNPEHLKIFNIKLHAEGTFNRKYELFKTVSFESNKQSRKVNNTEERIINEGNLYNFNFKDAVVSNTAINLPDSTLSENFFFIQIHNNNDKPIDINEISIIYYIDRVVFKSYNNDDISLYFGNSKAQQPKYDIETYRNHVLKEKMDECLLGAIQRKEGISEKDKKELIPAKTQKIILTVTIILISVILIFFLIRKMSGLKP
jgi:hypothetical protein